MKRVLGIICLMCLAAGVYAGGPFAPSVITMHTLNISTSAAEALPVQGGVYYFYNPDIFPVQISTSATSLAPNRFTLKAASYAAWPIEANSQLYAIGIGTGSVKLEAIIAR